MTKMREEGDIDDYFRVFEMTAKTHLIPIEEWLGSLVPRLTEKAKNVYLEIQGKAAQDFYRNKEIILHAYQRTPDYYRYCFRYSEKERSEDFVIIRKVTNLTFRQYSNLSDYFTSISTLLTQHSIFISR